MSTRPSRDRRKAAAEEEEAAVVAAPAPVSKEQAIEQYRKDMLASVAELDAALAAEGGKRGLIPPAPTPEMVAERDEKLATAKPREPTDQELGLGELGIPERRVRGIGAAWNFTMGPVLLYEGPKDLDRIHALTEPHIVVAKYIPEPELKKMEKTRVRGFVIEKGSVIDPTYWVYRDENRAAVLGAEGATELALEGESAVVDGVRGVAYFGPDAGTLDDYEYLRSIGPPFDDPLLKEAVRHLAGAVMGTRIKNKEQPPYEFKEQDRLVRVAKQARLGEPIPPEDDAWMKAIILVGMPTLEDMQATAKKPKEIGRDGEMPMTAAQKKAEEEKAAAEAPPAEEKKDERRSRRDEKKEAAAEKKDEAKDEAKPAEAAKKDDKAPAAPAAPAKAETAEDRAAARKAQREAEIAAAQAARSKKEGGEAKPAEAPKPEQRREPLRVEDVRGAGGDAPKPAEPAKTETAEDRAAARKAQREAEIAAAQAARSKKDKKEEPKKDEKPPAPPAAGGDDDDPLGYQT